MKEEGDSSSSSSVTTDASDGGLNLHNVISVFSLSDPENKESNGLSVNLPVAAVATQGAHDSTFPAAIYSSLPDVTTGFFARPGNSLACGGLSVSLMSIGVLQMLLKMVHNFPPSSSNFPFFQRMKVTNAVFSDDVLSRYKSKPRKRKRSKKTTTLPETEKKRQRPPIPDQGMVIDIKQAHIENPETTRFSQIFSGVSTTPNPNQKSVSIIFESGSFTTTGVKTLAEAEQQAQRVRKFGQAYMVPKSKKPKPQ